MRVVATAGHVDHGKSTLVFALTGTDPDRFEEEKRRGLTIDLGFAHTVLPSGAGISFVDVPGHVRFLRNMLAGVGAVDACLFVVAATEGWKPQSEEHLRILEMLGIRHGVIVLTKRDLVDAESLEIARLDVADHVAGTFLAEAPIVAVAAPSGAGLDELRTALDDLVARTPPAPDRGRARLWIDRVFAAKGSGTVVTGTLIDGSVRRDDQLVVEPGARSARVRGIQTLGAGVDAIAPGNRVALNLSGVAQDDLHRGDCVVAPGRWRTSDRFDATLDVLATLGHEVSRRGAYMAYVGSRELPVRLRLLGADALAPGTRGSVRVFLPVPLPMLPGDRYVLRESGRDETIGGGEVLDIAPVTKASHAAPDGTVERAIAERGWVDVGELELLTGVAVEPVIGHWATTPELLEATRLRVRTAIETAGEHGVDTAALAEHERARRADARRRDRARRSGAAGLVRRPVRGPPAGGRDQGGRVLAGDAARRRPDDDPRADPPRDPRRARRRAVPQRRRRRRGRAGSRACCAPTRPASRSPRSASRQGSAASTRSRSWPSSTHEASHGEGMTCE